MELLRDEERNAYLDGDSLLPNLPRYCEIEDSKQAPDVTTGGPAENALTRFISNNGFSVIDHPNGGWQGAWPMGQLNFSVPLNFKPCVIDGQPVALVWTPVGGFNTHPPGEASDQLRRLMSDEVFRWVEQPGSWTSGLFGGTTPDRLPVEERQCFPEGAASHLPGRMLWLPHQADELPARGNKTGMVMNQCFSPVTVFALVYRVPLYADLDLFDKVLLSVLEFLIRAQELLFDPTSGLNARRFPNRAPLLTQGLTNLGFIHNVRLALNMGTLTSDG
jgi:hypothetical protein